MRLYSRLAFAVLLVAAPFLTLQAVGPDAGDWNQTVDKAVAFLRQHQAADGSFSKEKSLGITGVVMTGVLQTGRVQASDKLTRDGLKFIESLVNEKEKHIAGQNPRDQLKNYVTAVNVMAFAASKDPKYKQVVAEAADFLKKLQWDEGEEKIRQDAFYGGAGYDSKSRPDLSNTQFFIDALKASGISSTDEAYKKAVIFVSRCQNLKGETNDQPWAGSINDGSFIYSAAGGGETKAVDPKNPPPTNTLPGYASMTYAGVKSLIYAGVDKNDKRVQAAIQWLQKNYSVEKNVGMPDSMNQLGLYYYYHTMAKCLDALGDDYFVDAAGVKHDWRKEIADALKKRQRPDGSWTNEADRWMEGDANLVTGYCLMTLSYCKPKK